MLKRIENIVGRIFGVIFWIVVVYFVYNHFFSDTAKIKDYLKCSIAANHLSMGKTSREIEIQASRLVNQANLSSRDIAKMGQEVRDDMDLYRLNPQGRYEKLVKIYNSGTCQKMHSQGEIDD
ncbi:hypothetical protein QV06_07565 [Gallibacterium genomosp. 3]|uniref:Uncharacterized protein n=1 Tax=Gallibacterium genomosp. 3 TaxID=505345 RepID=A0A1A7PSS9_9PAST|nr:hypothetical protein [Gallibacterium genomosp. 3]OBX04210.1 hypothetical protein QV06_07565 [Gallibacterium genomosp. 3]